MNIYMNQTQLQFNDDQTPKSLLVHLAGETQYGESIQCTIFLTPDDFPKGMDLKNFTLDQAQKLARQKAISYLQPHDTKTVDQINS